MLRFSGSIACQARGRNPCISINNRGIVIELHQPSAQSSIMYYQIGEIRADEVEFHAEKQLCKGKHPKVAENENVVVVVFEANTLWSNVSYAIGRLTGDVLHIDWKKVRGLETSADIIGRGKLPAIAIHNDRCVIAYEKVNGTGVHTYYQIGNIDGERLLINWRQPMQLFTTGVCETSIAIMKDMQ